MHSQNGSHRTELSSNWKVFYEKMPRYKIVYFAQFDLRGAHHFLRGHVSSTRP